MTTVTAVIAVIGGLGGTARIRNWCAHDRAPQPFEQNAAGGRQKHFPAGGPEPFDRCNYLLPEFQGKDGFK